MEVSLQGQVYIFLATLIGGLAIGLSYDLYRLFRYYFKPKRIKTFIQDLIFWLLLSLVIVLFINRVNEGEFRGFIFIGFTLGIILYSRLLSKYVIKFMSYLIDLIIEKVLMVINLILKPFRNLKISIKIQFNKYRKYFNLPSIFYNNTKKSLKTILKKK